MGCRWKGTSPKWAGRHPPRAHAPRVGGNPKALFGFKGRLSQGSNPQSPSGGFPWPLPHHGEIIMPVWSTGGGVEITSRKSVNKIVIFRNHENDSVSLQKHHTNSEVIKIYVYFLEKKEKTGMTQSTRE